MKQFVRRVGWGIWQALPSREAVGERTGRATAKTLDALERFRTWQNSKGIK